MHHAYAAGNAGIGVRVSPKRAENLLGALVVVLDDRIEAAARREAGDGPSAAAAMTTLLTYSDRDMSIERLRRVLGLSHSATVRLVDRLAERGLVRRRGGRDARERTLVLTRKGRSAARRVLAERERLLGDALAPLDVGKRAELAERLEQILGALTGSRLEARNICRLCDHQTCAETGGCPVDQAATRLGQ
jgi:MarR family transcriptional repressor of emrRAB